MRLPKPLILGIQIAEKAIQGLTNMEKMGNTILYISASKTVQTVKHVIHMSGLLQAKPQKRNNVALFQLPVFQ